LLETGNKQVRLRISHNFKDVLIHLLSVFGSFKWKMRLSSNLH